MPVRFKFYNPKSPIIRTSKERRVLLETGKGNLEMTDYDLNDEATVNFLNEAYRLPEGFIASLPECEKDTLQNTINGFVHTKLDEGNRVWAWCVEDLLGELSSEIEDISRDYTEPLCDIDEDDMIEPMEVSEFALGSIQMANSLSKKLLPIYEDQLMKYLKWHKRVINEADQITVEKLVENSEKQQAIYQAIYKELEKERNAA
jgi:hypothetical protein